MSDVERRPFLVAGLGDFGGAVALTLNRIGCEVIAIDRDQTLVQRYATDLGRVIEADCTDAEVLHQLGVAEFRAAVVAIGSDIEASVLTVLALVDAGLTSIWAEAGNENHARILRRMGTTHVVIPEERTGEHVGFLLGKRMLDAIRFDDGFTIARIRAPQRLVGRSLANGSFSGEHKVIVIGLKRAGQELITAVHDIVICADDELLASGEINDLERFAGE